MYVGSALTCATTYRNPIQIHCRIEVCRHERILGYPSIYRGGGGGGTSIDPGISAHGNGGGEMSL